MGKRSWWRRSLDRHFSRLHPPFFIQEFGLTQEKVEEVRKTAQYEAHEQLACPRERQKSEMAEKT